MTPQDRFPKMDVPVTLTGEEWTVVLGRILQRQLSPAGVVIYNRAATKLQDQLLAASKKSLEDAQ